jgi:hypothetical protein
VSIYWAVCVKPDTHTPTHTQHTQHTHPPTHTHTNTHTPTHPHTHTHTHTQTDRLCRVQKSHSSSSLLNKFTFRPFMLASVAQMRHFPHTTCGFTSQTQRMLHEISASRHVVIYTLLPVQNVQWVLSNPEPRVVLTILGQLQSGWS